MDVLAYLNRLDLQEPEAPGLAFLRRLQDHHLRRAPFENLDVRRGVPIRLEIPQLYDKIVWRRRGGFCYELNGLFSWLLGELGFRVTRVSARVYDAGRGSFGPEFDHMALLVDLDQTYLVDVGFGDSFRQPLPLPAGEGQDAGGRHRLRRAEGAGAAYQLERLETDGWQPQYRFTVQARGLDEYRPMCAFHQQSAESSFTRRTVCTRATLDGRVTLSQDHLTLTSFGRAQKVPIPSRAAFHRLLWLHFGVSLRAEIETGRPEFSGRE